ncbi:MAG: hypothetical protein GY856_15110 [bacterium]|nr:hypothetical protein [bacterium]
MKADTARQKRHLTVAILVALALGLVPGSSFAQSRYPYTVGLMGGLGGATDANPDTGLDNVGWQALFAMDIDVRTLFSVRAGQLDLETDAGELYDGELSYVTLSGEYRMTAGFYESGLFLGLGYYNRGGAPLGPDDSALGLTLGSTGDFRLSDRFSLLVELAGHYADLDQAQFFLHGHVGVAFHF